MPTKRGPVSNAVPLFLVVSSLQGEKIARARYNLEATFRPPFAQRVVEIIFSTDLDSLFHFNVI